MALQSGFVSAAAKLAWLVAGAIALTLLVLLLLNYPGAESVAIAALSLLLLFTPLLLSVRALLRQRQLSRNAATLEDMAALTRRIYALEQQLARLTAALQELSARGEAAAAAPPTTAPPPVLPREPAIPPPVQPPAAEVAAPAQAGPADLQIAPQAADAAKPEGIPAPTPPEPSHAAAPPPLEEIQPARAPRWGELEERLGTNWLGKVGVAVLVLGLAYFANYLIQRMGPGGKALVLYLIATAMLAAGWIAERRERYRVLGRGLLGGAWALLYFTSYAVHNIPAIRLIESPAAAFVLLFVVAAVMVAHSLRYDSQMITGIAYLLAFASVAVSELNVAALLSNALLAASLVVVLARRQWYGLELPAIAATYGVHWYWLWQKFTSFGHKPFAEFPASAALLTAYWAIFTVSHFLRSDAERSRRRWLALAFVLNLAGYLAVMRYQSFYPQWRFWFLLGCGVAYAALALLSRRLERRLSFLLTSTLAAALLLVAVPYRYSGTRLELLWLVEALALLVIGWKLADRHLRRLGWLALAALATYVLFHDLAPRIYFWKPPDVSTGLLLLTLAVAYLLTARFAPVFLAAQAEAAELAAARLCYPIAAALLLCSFWFALPMMWAAVAWSAMALLWTEAARRSDDRAVRLCGHGSALLAAMRLLAINLQYAPAIRGVSLRVLTVALGAGLLYFNARRLRLPEPPPAGTVLEHWDQHPHARAAYSWTATTLLALLLWYEVANAGVGLAWALLGLALLEVGRGIADRPLRAQGHTLLLLSFARIFFADLNADRLVGPVTSRLLTVTTLSVLFYFAAVTLPDSTRRLRAAYLWCGTLALVALLRFEVPTIWVPVAWAALVVALFAAGTLADARRGAGAPFLEGRVFRLQACAVAILASVRCAFDNFYQTRDWWIVNERTVTVAAAALLLYVALLIARLRPAQPAPLAEDAGRWWRLLNWFDSNPHQLFFFAPTLLLTVLVGLEVRKGYLTAAWGLEAFLIFVVALKLGERSYRWFSLALFLFCLARIAAVDFWAFDQLGRIISLVALGAALLSVSFLYARFRELWKKYM